MTAWCLDSLVHRLRPAVAVSVQRSGVGNRSATVAAFVSSESSALAACWGSD